MTFEGFHSKWGDNVCTNIHTHTLQNDAVFCVGLLHKSLLSTFKFVVEHKKTWKSSGGEYLCNSSTVDSAKQCSVKSPRTYRYP